jgi:hypothetical protein
MGRHAEWLRVEAEVDDHLLGRAGNSAEIGVRRNGPRIVHLDPLLLLLFRGSGRLGGFAFFAFACTGHDGLLVRLRECAMDSAENNGVGILGEFRYGQGSSLLF